MRFIDTHDTEYTAPSDPTKPKTVWSIRPITFFDTIDIERDAGAVPVRGTKIYFSLIPPDDTPTEEETAEQKEERLTRRAIAFRDAYMALSDDDKAAVDDAKAYLARYNYFVCVRGVVAIDGQKLTRDEVAERLAMMAPRESVPAILAEVSTAIGALATGDAEKKESSAPHAG